MKIISKGKYTSKIYICEHCDCTFEIDGDDIFVERVAAIGRKEHLNIYVECPECKRMINIEGKNENIN